MRKNHRRGETLIETLVAILVITLSALLLATVTTGSVRINAAAREKDSAFRQELENAETGTRSESGTVTLRDAGGASLGSYSVLYSAGGDGALTSYRMEAGS